MYRNVYTGGVICSWRLWRLWSKKKKYFFGFLNTWDRHCFYTNIFYSKHHQRQTTNKIGSMPLVRAREALLKTSTICWTYSCLQHLEHSRPLGLELWSGGIWQETAESGCERALSTFPSERVCCLLVLNSVTSTPQWMLKEHLVYLLVYKNLGAHHFQHLLQLSRLRLALRWWCLLFVLAETKK